jgi:hypothetical protein
VEAPQEGPQTVVGLDLGQVSDYSALATVQAAGQDAKGRTIWAVPLLRRWQLGTSYPQVVKDVAAIAGELPRPALVLDATGVGAAVADLFAAAALPVGRILRAVITGGHAVPPPVRGQWSVPKVQLVSAVQAALQGRRLKIASRLKEAATLTRELSTFKVKITTAGNETFESWRERDHDDLVLAVALAVWFAERDRPQDWNIRELRLHPGAPSGIPPTVAYPEIRHFGPTNTFQPMPRPGGELLVGCPDFKTQAEAAYFTVCVYRALDLEPPDVSIELPEADRARVEAAAAAFVRQRRLLPQG